MCQWGRLVLPLSGTTPSQQVGSHFFLTVHKQTQGTFKVLTWINSTAHILVMLSPCLLAIGMQSSLEVASIGGVAKVMLNCIKHLLWSVGIPGIQQLQGK